MTGTSPSDRAATEAASWCARLNARSVSTADLEAFYAWRRQPENAAAYGETEHAWRTSRGLGSDPDIGAALADVLARPSAHRAWYRDWRLQLGLFASALLAVFTGFWVITRPLILETGIGEQRLVRLADGSRVRLDTQSRVEVRIGTTERDVTLTRGQAFFEVAKDSARPFLVTAEGSTVRALGTRFGVRSNTGSVAVVLDEGSVRVTGGTAGSAILRPGEVVTLIGGKVGRPAPADLGAMTSWTTGRLIFRDTPLVQAVAEMNRYAAAPIVLASGRAADLRVNGVFDTGNTEGFVMAASAVSGLHVEPVAGGGIRLVD